MTLRQLFRRSYLSISVMEAGQDLDEDDRISDAIQSLETMLDRWSIQTLTIPAVTHQEFTAAPGQRIYTYGPNGDWQSPRPIKILHGEYMQGAVLCPLDIIDLVEYTHGAGDRLITSNVPSRLYHEPSTPENTIRFDCAPSYTYVIKLKVLLPLLDIVSLGCSQECDCCSNCTANCTPSTEDPCEGEVKYRVKGAWPDNKAVAEAAIAQAMTETVPTDDCGNCCEVISWTYNIADLNVPVTGNECWALPNQVQIGQITVERYYDKARTTPKPLSLLDDLELPHGYKSTIESNLAMELAPIYGVTPTKLVTEMAENSLKSLKAYNSKTPSLRVDKALQQHHSSSSSHYRGLCFGRA